MVVASIAWAALAPLLYVGYAFVRLSTDQEPVGRRVKIAALTILINTAIGVLLFACAALTLRVLD